MGKVISFFLAENCNCQAFSFLSMGYTIFFAAAALSFLALAWIELHQRSAPSAYFFILVISMVFGFIGARVIPVVQGIFQQGCLLNKGMVFYGGLAGLCLSSLVLARAWGLKLFPYLDIVTLYIPLAHSFGRVGCFLAGCCFGRITKSSMGICYPRGTPPYRQHHLQGLIGPEGIKSLPVIPVQIIESVLNLLIFAVLYYIYKRKPSRDGELLATYLIAYATCRFFLEFPRDDAIRGVYFGISTAQYISATVIIAVICIIRRPVLPCKRTI